MSSTDTGEVEYEYSNVITYDSNDSSSNDYDTCPPEELPATVEEFMLDDPFSSGS